MEKIGFPEANREVKYVSILVWLLTIAFLTVPGGRATESRAQPTATPTTVSADAAPVQRPADLLLSQYLRFGRFTAKDGLSSNQVFDITQDKHGFMWFATTDGLNRYDGVGVKVYRYNPNDPHSLSQSIVRSLGVDQSGNVWVGT